MAKWILERQCGLRILLVGLTAVMIAATPRASAQSLWEVSPYRITVWMSIQQDSRIPVDWNQDLKRILESDADSQIGAGWVLTVNETPRRFVQELLADRSPTWEAVIKAVPELQQDDKLLALNVEPAVVGYEVQVRELDLRTQTWTPAVRQSAGTWSQVPAVAFDLLCEAFVPLVRIVHVDDESVTASLRAGALLRPAESSRSWTLPTEVQEGDVLQPVIVRTDRNGQVPPDGAKPIDWTVLIVKTRSGSNLECQFISGYRQPFSARRSARVDQLAWLIKPRFPATQLEICDRRDPDQPLVGYEVYSRPPDVERSEFVGRTDWAGRLSITPDPENPVRVLFVRSGTQLLAKLPLVPGAHERLQAPLRNDDLRLEAEGFLLGIQESLVDLVARREVLSTRIRQRIENGQLEEAEQMLNELRRLDTQEDFSRRVQQRKQSLSSVSPEVQQKIDELFPETRTLLGQYLDPKRVQQLQSQLDAARRQAESAGDAE